jgi:hypothetical protein
MVSASPGFGPTGCIEVAELVCTKGCIEVVRTVCGAGCMVVVTFVR